jgi:hypothetical protein
MRFFDAGKEIRKILLNDDTLKGVIDNRIYPLVADKGTKFPFIVYRRESTQAASNKDAVLFDVDSTVSIIIATDNYSRGVEIASIVSDVLQIADNIELVGSEERYSDDTFLQLLTYTIKTKE